MKKNIKNTGKLFFNKNFTLLVITILICNVFIINNTIDGTYPISGKMNNSNLQADFNWRVNLYNSEIVRNKLLNSVTQKSTTSDFFTII